MGRERERAAYNQNGADWVGYAMNISNINKINSRGLLARPNILVQSVFLFKIIRVRNRQNCASLIFLIICVGAVCDNNIHGNTRQSGQSVGAFQGCVCAAALYPFLYV